MARSIKASPIIIEELTTTHSQPLLFAVRRTDEEPEMTIARPEEKRTARTKRTIDYSSSDIQVLEGIAAIRHRPGMYIGSTSTSGLLHLIWEALDNAVDEAVAGYGKHIWLHVDREGWVTVRDEGRGMPFDPMLYKGE